MGPEGARPLQTRLLCRNGGVDSLTAGLITVLLRQEPQLLRPPLDCAPRPLSRQRPESSEREKEPEWKNGECDPRARQSPRAQLWDHHRELKGPTSPRSHSRGSGNELSSTPGARVGAIQFPPPPGRLPTFSESLFPLLPLLRGCPGGAFPAGKAGRAQLLILPTSVNYSQMH